MALAAESFQFKKCLGIFNWMYLVGFCFNLGGRGSDQLLSSFNAN